jgi:hypothetical protein
MQVLGSSVVSSPQAVRTESLGAVACCPMISFWKPTKRTPSSGGVREKTS